MGTGGNVLVLVVVEVVDVELELVEPGDTCELVVDVEWWDGAVDVLVPRLVGPGGDSGWDGETPVPSTVTTTTLPPTATAPPMHRRSPIVFLPAMAPTFGPQPARLKGSYPHPQQFSQLAGSAAVIIYRLISRHTSNTPARGDGKSRRDLVLRRHSP